mgnify:CR=1 FL=1
MLDCCTEFFNTKVLEFNVDKSSCFSIGSASKHCINPMNLQGKEVNWNDNFKYLGINFNCGKCITINLDGLKRRF